MNKPHKLNSGYKHLVGLKKPFKMKIVTAILSIAITGCTSQIASKDTEYKDSLNNLKSTVVPKPTSTIQFDRSTLERPAVQARSTAGRSTNSFRKLLEARPVMGNPNAPYTYAVFIDVECVFCKKEHFNLINLTREKHELVNVKYFNMPNTKGHGMVALEQAVLTECTLDTLKDDRAYYSLITDLFATTGSNGRGSKDRISITRSYFTSIEQLDDMFECMTSGYGESIAYQHLFLAREIGIKGTPSGLLINNANGKMRLLKGVTNNKKMVEATINL